MSGADSDSVVGFVLSLLALVALVLLLPLICAYYSVGFVGRTLVRRKRRRNLLGRDVRTEHERIAVEQAAAIREVVALRQRSEHELRLAAQSEHPGGWR